MYKLYLFEDFDNISESFLKQCMDVLPPERRQKALRYKFEIDRKMSVISYLMLLYALRKNYGINNPQIVYGKYGKPYLKDYPDIYFNVSHCIKGCICAVSDREIGVDIQEVRTFSWNIAKRVCCNNELKMLECADDKARLFTRIWAIKESYLKMMGYGITGMLDADTTVLTDHIEFFENEDYMIAVTINHNFILEHHAKPSDVLCAVLPKDFLIKHVTNSILHHTSNYGIINAKHLL